MTLKGCKQPRTKQSDCLDCVWYRQTCDGYNLYDPQMSKWGRMLCANKKENMSAEEVDDFLKHAGM